MNHFVDPPPPPVSASSSNTPTTVYYLHVHVLCATGSACEDGTCECLGVLFLRRGQGRRQGGRRARGRRRGRQRKRGWGRARGRVCGEASTEFSNGAHVTGDMGGEAGVRGGGYDGSEPPPRPCKQAPKHPRHHRFRRCAEPDECEDGRGDVAGRLKPFFLVTKTSSRHRADIEQT
jgi:hypothetical protein